MVVLVWWLVYVSGLLFVLVMISWFYWDDCSFWMGCGWFVICYSGDWLVDC